MTSLRQQARDLGVPYTTLWARRQKSIQTPGFQEAYLGARVEEVSDKELWDLTSSMGHTLVAGQKSSEYVEVVIDDNRPIAIAFTGDWHIGNIGTDMHMLEEDLEKLAAAEGVYVVGMGDYLDNYKVGMGRASEGLYHASLPNPEDQRRLAAYGLRKVNPRLLAATRGCHLDWDGRDGLDTLQDLLRGLDNNVLGRRPANFGYGGVLRVVLNGQSYVGLVRHRYRENGALNTTNSQRRAANEYPSNSDWDFITFGHLHFPDLQIHELGGREQVWLRSGSYKILDQYGQKLGGLSGSPGVPLLILHPTEHKMWAFYGPNLDAGLETLRAIREGTLKW